MSLASEFKEFAVKGNVIDLAVGVIVGGAFGKIVDSLVKDIIMPVVGKATGGLDFSNHFLLLGQVPADYKGAMTYAELSKAGVPMLAWGNFLTVGIGFLILAFIIFMMVKQINRLKREAPPAPPAAPAPKLAMVLSLSTVVDVGDRYHTKPPFRYRCDTSESAQSKPLYTVQATLGSFVSALTSRNE